MSKFGTEITLQLGTAVGTRRGSFWNFQIRDERSGKVLLQFGLTQEEMGKALATQAVTVPATVWTDPRHGQFCETRMVTVPIAKMLTHNGYDQDAMKVEVFLWLALNETKGMVLGEDWIPEIEAEWNTHRFDRDSHTYEVVLRRYHDTPVVSEEICTNCGASCDRSISAMAGDPLICWSCDE